MADIIKAPLIKFGIPNRNGIVFTEESVKETVKDSTRSLIGVNDPPSSGFPSISEASHVASNIRIEDDQLVVDIIVMETTKGKFLQEFLRYVEFAPIGYGKVDNDGVVSDYELIGTTIIPKG